MKILVTGDRDYKDKGTIKAVLALFATDKPEVLHGACRGADMLADEAAKELGLKVDGFPADWTRLGHAAGPVRNLAMLDQLEADTKDIVLAFHDHLEKSKGTAHCVNEAKLRGIKVILFSGAIPHNPFKHACKWKIERFNF
jgi:hypothetical protein